MTCVPRMRTPRRSSKLLEHDSERKTLRDTLEREAEIVFFKQILLEAESSEIIRKKRPNYIS